MTWPHDGPPLTDIWEVRARLDRLIDPWQKLRIQAQWLFSGYMRRRKVRW